jgi:acyl-CoA synthetase (AMP-forming)/AMP-acid ligase II
LYKHPDIDECAVIGIPDKLLGEDICAFVKIKDKSQLTKNDLEKFCKDEITSYKQPKKIIIINNLVDLNEIPKGPTKKILYRKLKEYYSNSF